MGLFKGKIAASTNKTLAETLTATAADRELDREHEHWISQDYTSKAHEADVRAAIAAKESKALTEAAAILEGAGVTL